MKTERIVSDHALALHRELVILDALTSSPNTSAQAKRMVQGGLTATNLTAAWVEMGFRDVCKAIAGVRADIEKEPVRLLLATRVTDIHRAKEMGKSAVVIGLQNGKSIEDDLDILNVLYQLGLRVLQLTYNARNYLADGCTERVDGGLSYFGADVVEMMAELGIAVDLSHCGQRTCLDTIDLSPKPVLITHANPTAIFPNPRNKSDEVILRLASKGGVIGVCAWSPLLVRQAQTRPRLSDLIDAIDYLVNLVGIDHVGIGTDLGEGTYVPEEWDALYLQQGVHSEVTRNLGEWWAFGARFPEELSSVVYLPRITEALLARGYTDEEIRKLWGANVLRVLEAVWKD